MGIRLPERPERPDYRQRKPTMAEIRRAEREAHSGDWIYLAGIVAFLAVLAIARLF
jgi:hypothetical protein